MRLSHCLLICALLVGVNALNGLRRRSTVDTCGNVNNAELKVQGFSFGRINSCLCESTLPTFILTNVPSEAAVLQFGTAPTIAALTALITSASGSETCTYPDNAIASCEVANPCFFTCGNGFTASPSGDYPTDCVCDSPYTVCNGVCGVFTSCSSGLTRRAVSHNNCPARTTACPVPGRGRAAWECVDTTSDLESCGGCIYPSVNDPTGVDCTTIEGVSDVACHRGRCLVKRCMPGYQTDISNSHCVDDNVLDVSDVLAVAFGLEHVPL
jgi:hypothetical protein